MLESLRTTLSEFQKRKQEKTIATEFLSQMVSSQNGSIQKSGLEIMEELKNESIERGLKVGGILSRVVETAYIPYRISVSPDEAELGLDLQIELLHAQKEGKKDYFLKTMGQVKKRAEKESLDWGNVRGTWNVLMNPGFDYMSVSFGE